MSNINVAVNASLDAGGNVVCELECQGHQARVTFKSDEVVAEVLDPVPGSPAAMAAYQSASNEIRYLTGDD